MGEPVGTVDIVIPVHNGEDTIIDCLEGIKIQQIPDGWRIDITVVDDASTDDSVIRISQYNDLEVHLIANRHNLGRARTRNRGMRNGTGDIVTFLDCDCVFENPNVLKRFIELINSGKDCVFANVVSKRDDFSGRYTNELAGNRFKSARDGRYIVMTSASFAIRRSLLIDVGGFCEDYTHYGFEDRDLIAMLQGRGGRLAVDEQCLVHHKNAIDPHLSSRKLHESAKFSAPVFSHRFPDVYKQISYGKIDPSLGSFVPDILYSFMIGFLPIFQKLAAKSLPSTIVPYQFKKIMLKTVSFLAYLKVCLERNQ